MTAEARIDDDGNIVLVLTPTPAEARHLWGVLGDLLKEADAPEPEPGGF